MPSINYTRGLPVVFKTPHHEDLKTDYRHRIVDVAMATSAAPIVFPRYPKAAPSFSASRLLLNAPYVSRNTRNDDVPNLFAEHPNLHAVAIVEDRRPIGLISRHSFVDAYAFPYRRELHGRKYAKSRPCDGKLPELHTPAVKCTASVSVRPGSIRTCLEKSKGNSVIMAS